MSYIYMIVKCRRCP